MTAVTVAGDDVPDPLSAILSYVTHHGRTLRAYDLGGQGDPHKVTSEEIARTRVISSRISNCEREWLLARAREAGQLWRAIPANARLADADPADLGGLYDHALALFRHFSDHARRGIALGKLSKVLHLKRPALFPILDSQLTRAYRGTARAAAERYRTQRPETRLSYWAAIRDDATDPGNLAAIDEVRCALRQHENALVRRVGDLSDVRLLDLLTWKPTRQEQG